MGLTLLSIGLAWPIAWFYKAPGVRVILVALAVSFAVRSAGVLPRGLMAPAPGVVAKAGAGAHGRRPLRGPCRPFAARDVRLQQRRLRHRGPATGLRIAGRLQPGLDDRQHSRGPRERARGPG